MVSLGRSLVLAGALVGALALPGCGNIDAGVDTDGGPAGQQDANLNPGEGGIDQDPPNPTCHEQRIEPQRVGDPDIMILMDKSSSMDESGKWTQTAGAVTNTVTALETAGSPIAWGLIFFPTDSDCAVVGPPTVEVGVANAGPISSAINGTSPNGNTPAHKAVDLAVASYAQATDDRAHYILIATDGQPNCEGDVPVIPKTCNPAAPACNPGEICQAVPGFGGICIPEPLDLAIKSIQAAAAAGIKTFVVGIDIDSGAADTLNRMAEAGGTARASTTKYYPVSDQATLEDALANITTQIISCTFQLDALPPDQLYVFVNVAGQDVPNDPNHADGWDIDMSSHTLTFYGDACSALQENPQTVQITYGCPPPG
ncbi:MAG TPA: vWA domain-containing protein [Polyangia bacterium]|jgi:hypothetical protein